ncbi:MAG: S8 family serine peptidase [Acidimicrobiia bacterium]
MRSTLFRFFVVLSLLAGLLVVTAASGSAQPESVQVDGAGRGYYVVALDGPITEADAAALRATGAELLAYEPDFAYQVRMAADAADVIAGLDGVTAVTSVRGADKLAGDLAATGLYRIRFQRGVDAAAAAVDIAAAGVQVLAAQGSVMAVQGDLAAMQSVAGLAEVAWVENHTFRETHNEYGAGSIVGTAAAHANGYDGSTQTVAVADTGIGGGTAATAHIDIPSARVAAVYNWPGIPSAGCYNVIGDAAQDVDSGHGTHVAVSVLGDGNGSGIGTGSAPAARLVFQAIEDWADMISACALFNPDGYYLIGIPEDFTGLFQQAYDAGARIHSNSWGSDANGDYTSDSVTVDTFMWNHRDMLITYSAGNSGVDANADGVIDNDSIGSPATAKNTLTVGASENDRSGNWNCDDSVDTENACTGGQNALGTYGSRWPADYPAAPISNDLTAGNAQQMAAFSSRGPTDDGRIKPDVVAPGTWILSGYSDLYQFGYDGAPNPQNGAFQYDGWGTPYNDDYKYMGGTSMSNPITAGAAAVVRDFYDKAHGHQATAALTKATLINSAVDLLDENNDGVNDNDFPIPNNHEGWGLVNVAAATDGSAQFVDEGAGLTTGGTSSHTYAVAGGSPLRVSVVWTDYPSTASASVNLVNDLDVTVTGPGGVTYRGNVFSGGWSTTGGSADRLNNVENVYVQNAAAGDWTVTVTGFNVPFGPQPYALVVDGVGAGTGNNPPVAGFTSSCTGLSCTFTDASTDSDGTIDSRSWVFGDGGTSTATDPTHVYAAGGTYTVTLTVTDDDGATDTETQTVTVSGGGGGGTTMHVADLDGSGVITSGKIWTATATITVVDDTGAPVSGATVTGRFRSVTGLTCTTDGAGMCSISLANTRRRSETFTVTDVSHGTLTYDAAANTDPDGDSDGTVIVINRPGTMTVLRLNLR